MKLATYTGSAGTPVVGIVDVERDAILDIQRARTLDGKAPVPAFDSMLALIEAGDAALDVARELALRWPDEASQVLSSVKLLSPLPKPESIRDCLVYEQHLVNARRRWEEISGHAHAPIAPVWYQRATWYKGSRLTVVGHDADVIWPSYAELFDYEVELACVIGKRGRNLDPATAMDHIFGYTIFNDFSARDMQVVERPLGMGPMKSKDFDTGNVIGPWIVTADEIGDPHQLAMMARVNGEDWGGGNTRGMYHTFGEILADISRDETLHPGEVIASGTVENGSGFEVGRYIKPGDVVELEVEKIGVLRNRVVRHHEVKIPYLRSER